MAGVFISHASADKALVDPFVDDVIRLGCGVPSDQIFYSSGEDTGIPSGENLATHVRDRVADASIVVAIISPTFQTRPLCVAELGAAWIKVGNLLPIAVPGMDRTNLEGVLEGMVVRHMDEGPALDELHDRIGAAVAQPTDAKTWGRYKAKWLASVESYAEDLPALRAVTVSELEDLGAEFLGTKAALSESEAQRRTLEEQVAKLAAAKSDVEVAEILLPGDEVERFKTLLSEAKTAIGDLDPIVVEAMWFDIFESGMRWPDSWEDERGLERARAARRDGTLTENSSGLLVPDRDVVDVERAYGAVARLRVALGEASESFESWFRAEYGCGPDLRRKRLWDTLLV